MPGAANLPDAVKAQADDGQFKRMIAIINSMTPQGAKIPGGDQRVAQKAHRHGVGHPGAGCQPTTQAARANEQDDEENVGGWYGQNDAWQERQTATRYGVLRNIKEILLKGFILLD